MRAIEELEKLTDDELRVLLAELVGWRMIPNERVSSTGLLIGIRPDDKTGFVPNYPSDLDACHEVSTSLPMAKLNGRDRTSYWYTLRRGVLRNPYGNEVIDASPRDRTIALIFTLQK